MPISEGGVGGHLFKGKWEVKNSGWAFNHRDT